MHEIWGIFKKEMSILASLFPKLLMLRNVATQTSKRSWLRTPFANERDNRFQTPLKLARHHYYPLFSSIRGKLSCKKSSLNWLEFLRLFVKTFYVDDKYSGSNMQSLPQTFQTSLYQIKKLFLIFSCILKICMKFRAFSKKRWVS